jgi:hypothetical protein
MSLLSPSRFAAGSTAVVFLVALAACRRGEEDAIRGRGHRLATLPVAAQAQVYRAAVTAAFNAGDPNLVLLLHPRMLPRLRDDSAGAKVPAPLAAALADSGVVRGQCDPQPVPGRKTPRCPSADWPGYVVRFSDIFVLPADTLLFYFNVQRYDIASAPSTDVIHFENAYKVVPRSGRWEAVREGRIPR